MGEKQIKTENLFLDYSSGIYAAVNYNMALTELNYIIDFSPIHRITFWLPAK
jgi:hypothetical protein